jgi:FkbM family methyltransferase
MKDLFFRAKRRLRYEYLRRFDNPATLTTRQGIFRVPIGVRDPISRELFLRGEFELDLIGEAMDLLRTLKGRPMGKGTVLDVGANNGVISIGMLFTGQLDRAIAIEPEPTNFARLKENVSLNRFDDAILCINSAVSDRKASLEFELSDINYGDHRVRVSTGAASVEDRYNEAGRAVITVPADTLDALIAGLPGGVVDTISVMWVDVQGYEGFVFAGAREFLARDVPVVSEVWPYGITRSGMSLASFDALVKGIWPNFWVKRRDRFVRYPIAAFSSFLDELARPSDYDNVIFTHG